MSPIDVEKAGMPNETEVKPTFDANAIPVDNKEEVSSTEGDDALKLAGTHHHDFDEKYFTRLPWRIVSVLALGCKASAWNSQPFSRILILCLCSSSSVSSHGSDVTNVGKTGI